MREMDTLKLKIKRILDKELTDEELLMVGSITVKKSPEDINNERLKERAYKESHTEESIKDRDDMNERAIEGIKVLANHVGKNTLPYNRFTAGVSAYFADKGRITKAQEEAILNTYD